MVSAVFEPLLKRPIAKNRFRHAPVARTQRVTGVGVVLAGQRGGRTNGTS